jgi:hypothetical protein
MHPIIYQLLCCKRKAFTCFIATLLLPVFVFAQHGHGTHYHELSADSLVYYYNQSIYNSAYVSSSKISHNLIPLTDNNHNLISTKINGEKYIQVVTWKGSGDKFPANADSLQIWTGDSVDIWVTTAPELKNKVRSIDSNHVSTRIKQLLGVPPYATYTTFVAFWVRPQDLYRPCPDSETSDNSCVVGIPKGTSPQYVAWIDSQRISRFFGTDTAWRFPWTELGYTYDWYPENRTHQGCSEFVIRRYSKVYFIHKYTTNQYIYGKEVRISGK